MSIQGRCNKTKRENVNEPNIKDVNNLNEKSIYNIPGTTWKTVVYSKRGSINQFFNSNRVKSDFFVKIFNFLYNEIMRLRNLHKGARAMCWVFSREIVKQARLNLSPELKDSGIVKIRQPGIIRRDMLFPSIYGIVHAIWIGTFCINGKRLYVAVESVCSQAHNLELTTTNLTENERLILSQNKTKLVRNVLFELFVARSLSELNKLLQYRYNTPDKIALTHNTDTPFIVKNSPLQWQTKNEYVLPPRPPDAPMATRRARRTRRSIPNHLVNFKKLYDGYLLNKNVLAKLSENKKYKLLNRGISVYENMLLNGSLSGHFNNTKLKKLINDLQKLI